MTSPGSYILTGALAILVIVLGAWYLFVSRVEPDANPIGGSSSQGETITDGTLTFVEPPDFAVARTQAEIATQSYIPPCDQGFLYCIYYTGEQYASSTLESAGISIAKQSDLSAERLCLETPPPGYADTIAPNGTHSDDAYATTVFSPVSDAAAGHFATGDMYRIFVRSTSSCYEVTTRVGESQYANYPPGSISEFTEADRNRMLERLRSIVNGFTLQQNGATVKLPPVS